MFDVKKFEKIIKNFKGVPYKHQGNSKTLGMDCTMFIGNFLIDYGLMKKILFKTYSTEWYKYTEKELIIESCEENLNNAGLKYDIVDNPKDYKCGDLIGLKLIEGVDRTTHCAIYFNENYIYHCIQNVGVRKKYFSSAYKNIVTKIYRIKGYK